MLLQSHERIENGKLKSEYCHADDPISQFSTTQTSTPLIRLLPALPKAWKSGSFDGLVAQGNFVISAKWKDGKATAVSILSRRGGECRITAPGIGAATVTDSDGNAVDIVRDGTDRIRFASAVGERYAVEPVNEQKES
jgi:hypothetical protein